MSVNFQCPDGSTLDLTNGDASKLLYALGYTVSEDSDGEMYTKTARSAVEDVKTWGCEEQPDFLAEFEKFVVAPAEAAGWEKIKWT